MAICGTLRYTEWSARPSLRRFVRCTWTGGPAGRDAEPVLPDGCMDVIWDGSSLFVAGPDTHAVQDEREGPFVVGIRFRPGMGPLFLGPPAGELRDARVPLDAVWPDAASLADRLSEVTYGAAARALLEDAVADRLATDPRPDPLVEHAARAWSADPSLGVRTGTLALEGCLSERQLHRRFVTAVGYGPKHLQRVLRFQAFLALSRTPTLGLSDLAVRCGFYDQAHLSRDTAALAGRSPAELRSARLDDRNVQDQS